MGIRSTATMHFKRLTAKAHPPIRSSPLAAGFDLSSAYDYTIKAKSKEIVKTDLQVQIPSGCYGRIAPRSGLAVKHFIDVGAGVVDADYRGNVGVVLFNFSENDFHVKAGDRIAQLICERIEYAEAIEVDELTDTQRGSNGFGSTGVSTEPAEGHK